MKIANFEQGTAVVKKSYSGFGKAMMSKMGWSEGEGLGKNKHGSTALHLAAEKAHAEVARLLLERGCRL